MVKNIEVWFVLSGIVHGLTIAYSPESNGKKERLKHLLGHVKIRNARGANNPARCTVG